jgi:hypothetical protein
MKWEDPELTELPLVQYISYTEYLIQLPNTEWHPEYRVIPVPSQKPKEKP